jgi:hypothetical protein
MMWGWEDEPRELSVQEQLDSALGGGVWSALHAQDASPTLTMPTFDEDLALALADDLDTWGLAVPPYAVPLRRVRMFRTVAVVRIP